MAKTSILIVNIPTQLRHEYENLAIDQDDERLWLQNDTAEYYSLIRKRKSIETPSIIQETEQNRLELRKGGPGTFMYDSLKLLKLAFRKECKCKDRARIMNANGVDWCEQNQETILEWLREEANNQGIFFIESIARMLIRRSIKKTRKWAERRNNDDI